MTDRMWPLRRFRYDEGIAAAEVDVYGADGELEAMPRDQAIAVARRSGRSLIAEWPDGGLTAGAPVCVISKVSLPVRWEQPPPAGDEEPDERLWFEAPCGGRDLLTGSGNTFPGRMSAWCPARQVSYNVSLDEMGQMSPEARYYVAGFLAGNQPAAPEMIESDDGDLLTDDDDVAAWIAATRRFRQTGRWYGRWSTCETCGCVLLPDSSAGRCQEHRR